MARSIDIVGGIGVVYLTLGYCALIDEEDIGLVSGKNWCAQVKAGRMIYAARKGRAGIEPSTVTMHRIIAGAIPGEVIDHIDGDGLNNRRSNIRRASCAQNSWNRCHNPSNSSGLKGVSFDARTGLWRARIMADGVETWLGRHRTPELAHQAYIEAAEKIHGEFSFTRRRRLADRVSLTG